MTLLTVTARRAACLLALLFLYASFTFKASMAAVAETGTAYEVKMKLWEDKALKFYSALDFTEEKLDYQLFRKALIGYQNLKLNRQLSDKGLLTVIDFSLPSHVKRLWVIDLAANKVLYNSLVAHGKHTGNETATAFSNIPGSNQSSLGFYVTLDTYYGKHDLSLKLQGMDEGFNHNALSRAIVIHGADYVSDDFIRKYGRLGRSQGCPAVPQALSAELINLLAGQTCVFISGKDKTYDSASVWLNEAKAVEHFAENTI